jgi:type I restriction enzyme, S subunit
MSENWIERQLADVVGLDKGVTYASADYSDVHEGLPFFTIKCVQKGGGFNWSGVKFYSGPFFPNQALKCGDVLLALTDLTRAGDIIGSPIAVPNFPGADTVLASMDLCRLRPITDQIDTTFLYYRLMLADVRAFMLAHSAGSTVLHLETKSLPSLKFYKGRTKSETLERRLKTVTP